MARSERTVIVERGVVSGGDGSFQEPRSQRAWIVEASRRRASCPLGLETGASTRRDDEDPTATNPCRVRHRDSPLDRGRHAMPPRKIDAQIGEPPCQHMNSMSMASANG